MIMMISHDKNIILINYNVSTDIKTYYKNTVIKTFDVTEVST